MKLYYATGACSLAPHIVALEAGIPLETERVDILKYPHLTESGADYSTINPNLYVPALTLADGSLLTEVAALVQYLADLRPEAGLVPPPGTPERYRVQAWLTFVGTELHKMYSPWLFHPEYGAQAQAVARTTIARRLEFVESELARTGQFLTGPRFTVADGGQVNSETGAGLVAYTSPEGGAQLSSGDTVTLYTSTGYVPPPPSTDNGGNGGGNGNGNGGGRGRGNGGGRG